MLTNKRRAFQFVGVLRSGHNWPVLLAASLAVLFLFACSLNPNVRKEKYFQRGQAYFQKQQYREAVIEFVNSVKIDPAYAEGHYQLAECYVILRQFDRARQEFDRTLELRPDDYRARMRLADLLILIRDFREAQEQTDLLLKKAPFDPASHTAAASLLAAEHNIPGAIAETVQAIGLKPGQWELYLSLALLQVNNNQPEMAEASFKKVIELNPKAGEARILLGRFYQSQKRMDDAKHQFEDAIACEATSLDARKALAGLYLIEGKKAEAEQILLQAKRDLAENPDSSLVLSNFYYTIGDLEKSVAEYAALFQRHPKDLQIEKKYVQLLIETKHNESAHPLIEEILRANPADNDALVYRSEMQIGDGELAEAIRSLRTVVKNDPGNSQAHYALGMGLEKQGNVELGKSEFREASRQNSDMLEAYKALASAAIESGDTATLQHAATEIIRLQPGSADGYALRGLANINSKRYSEAYQDISHAIVVGPEEAFGYTQMGNLRFAQKQYSEAVKAYQDALDRNANSTDSLRGLVNALIAENQIDKAVTAVNAQIAKSPSNSSFYDLLGTILFHNKRDLRGAEIALDKSVALDKRNSDAVIQLCQVKVVKGEIDQAIATGEESIKQNPLQPNLKVLLGNLYASKGDWNRAGGYFQDVLAFNSQNPVASNGLARVMLHTGGNLDFALSLAQTAGRVLPDSPAVLDTLGWIYYQKGVYSLAINNLQQALRLQEEHKMPDNADIHYHLGMAYEKTEQPALARQHFEVVLKISPNFREASEIRNTLAHLKSL